MSRTTLGTPLHNAKHPKLKGAKAPFLFAESLYEALTARSSTGRANLTDNTVFQYQVTDFYSPEHERCIAWNDPDLNIDWGVRGEPIVSEKDAKGLSWLEFCRLG